MTSEDLKTLYELQQIDIQIAAAKRSKAALDDGSTLKAQVAALETRLRELNEALRKLEADLQDCELSLKTVESKKQNYERRLYAGEVTNPKELEGMEKEIAMLGRNKDKLETRGLELMDAVQEQREKVSAAEAELTARRADLAAIVSEYNKRSEELSRQIAGLDVERAAKAKAVDAASLRRYDNVRVHSGGVAVGKVEDGRCGACHVALLPFTQRQVKEGGEAVVCESCGRFLYLAE